VSRAQREKGKRGEREVANAFKDAGIAARRTAPMQSQNGAPEADVEVALPDTHLEVKRQETIKIEAWCRQAEAEAPPGASAVVVWRRSDQPWRVTLTLADYIELRKRAG